MIREAEINQIKIRYNIQIKNVKNINMRVKPDGTVNVSANRKVPVQMIDEFVISKADFIYRALKKYESIKEKPIRQYFDEEGVREYIIKQCNLIYPYYKNIGVSYPRIKFRKMKSRWGSCHTVKGILTFNTNLMYAPPECAKYVVIHEFTHFLYPDHSAEFYKEIEKIYPEWKQTKRLLRQIFLP